MKIYAVIDDENGYTIEEMVVGLKWFSTLSDAQAYRKSRTEEVLREWHESGQSFDDEEISDDMFYSIVMMDLY
jgi:hypothetical protein